jgi:hypothetical protein
MTRTTKYVTLDVPQATAVAAVCEQSGHVIARSILPTEATAVGQSLSKRMGMEHVTHRDYTRLAAALAHGRGSGTAWTPTDLYGRTSIPRTSSIENGGVRR